jgi:hypothetical protein
MGPVALPMFSSEFSRVVPGATPVLCGRETRGALAREILREACDVDTSRNNVIDVGKEFGERLCTRYVLYQRGPATVLPRAIVE